jgi:hypothetical protein
MIQYVSTKSKHVHHITTYYEHKPPSIKLMQRQLMIRMNVWVPKELLIVQFCFPSWTAPCTQVGMYLSKYSGVPKCIL